MGFIRATIDFVDKKFVITLYYTWLYIGEQIITEKFDSLEDAKEWILNERTYQKLEITDEARNSLSYKDALRLKLNKNNKMFKYKKI